jgi:hypothetical protein
VFRGCLLTIAGIILLFVVVIGVSVVANRRLPTSSTVVERLSDEDKARLAEIFHLRETLGEVTWPGWGTADIPIIHYNEAYVFLVGYPDPPSSWVKVPEGKPTGGPWEPVMDDSFNGETYYRQPLPASGETPQSFAVLIGDRWVGSLATMEWMKIGLTNEIRQDLPPPLAAVFPYTLFTGVLLDNSEHYMAAVLHETFHAYTGMVAPARLAEAEHANREESRYPWEDADLQEAWQVELDLLADALRADSAQSTADLARQFLDQRTRRRQEAELDELQIAYEQQREWLEGLAKYVELEIWRQAATTPGYRAVESLADDPEFEQYTTYDAHWSREVTQMRRMASDAGEGRFYYTGMGQAVLLDRLLPGWKEQAMQADVFLEALLGAAVP